MAASITEALPQSSQSPLQQSEATSSSLERQPDPVSTPSSSDPVSLEQTASTSRDLTVAEGPSKEFVVNCQNIFKDLLLEIMSKEKKPENQVKRRRLVTNCEIITTNEYLLKREIEEKEKNDKERLE